jgi:hypothetical protein
VFLAKQGLTAQPAYNIIQANSSHLSTLFWTRNKVNEDMAKTLSFETDD